MDEACNGTSTNADGGPLRNNVHILKKSKYTFNVEAFGLYEANIQ